MVRNNLKVVVDSLAPGKDKHYRSHARQAGVGWQQFSGMLHNKTRRVSLRNLQRIRNYLSALTDSITPGPITINLGDMMQARGLTQSQTAAGAGVGYVTVNRLVNSNVEYLDYNVIGKLCRFLAAAPDELVDTGGLLVLARD